MRSRRVLALGLLAGCVIGLSLPLRAADEMPKPAEPGTLIVVDAMGKDQKLKAWKFTTGTYRLSWLAPPVKEEPKDKSKKIAVKPTGPEALGFRAENSTTFAAGILTLIPFDRIRAIAYDNEMKSVTVHVATSGKPEDDLRLTGTTKYQGENKLIIEAEVDKGDMGIAEVKFQGGFPKTGIRGIRFPTPKAPEMPAAGRAVRITANDKAKTVHSVTDLQALYQTASGHYQLAPILMFKKTLKVDLGKVKQLRVLKTSQKEGAECEVIFKDGETQTLSMLKIVPIEGKESLLVGLLGKVKAGYQLFPIHTAADVQFDDKEEKK